MPLPILPIIGGALMLLGLIGRIAKPAPTIVHNHYHGDEPDGPSNRPAPADRPTLSADDRRAAKERAAARRAAARAAIELADNPYEQPEAPAEPVNEPDGDEQ